MADVKISALPAVVTAAGTDVFPVVQGGVTKQETLAQALTWIQTQVAPVAAGGTGFGTYTIGDLLVADGAASLAKLADVATGNALISGGVGAAPTWGKIGLTTHVSGTLAPGNGGTGLASYAVGDLIYASGATTLSKLADVATGQVLRSGGVGVAPAWGAVTLTTDVTGVLPSASGGTGVNNAGTLTNASNTTITGGGTLALGGFTLTVPATGSAALLATANVFTAAQSTTITDAVTGATTTLLTLDHESSGTPAANFGTRVLWNLQDNTTAVQAAAAIDVIWSNATHASHASQMAFFLATGGGGATSESLRLNSSGIATIGGNASTFMNASSLVLANSGNTVTFKNAGTAASTNLQIVGSGTIAATQYIGMLFAAVETARFSGDSAIASTAAVVDNLMLRRNPTSGTPAAGTGHQIHMLGKTSTTADRDQLTLSVEWVVATEASQTTRAKINVYDTAAREALRMEASGSAPMIGFLGAAAVVRQTGGANLTNNVAAGGTSDQIDNWTDLTTYATDAAAIRNAIYQLARTLKQDHDALRLYGFLT